MAAAKSPIFPMLEPHHFSDYGFDPQIDFFQVLGEARRHKREAPAARSIDSIHFKLQKPISKDDRHVHRHRPAPLKKRKWWRNALLFFRGRWAPQREDYPHHHPSVSGPVYLAESRSGARAAAPYRMARGPSSGPLAGTVTPRAKGDLQIPYLSLRELNMEPQQQQQRAAAMPIYLVT